MTPKPIRLAIQVYRGPAQSSPCKRLQKDIPWLCPPPQGAVVFAGLNEDGECAGINAIVNRVEWSSDGSISVEASVVQCRDEYDDILADLARDGFVEP